MKATYISSDYIEFDNGKRIESDFVPQCCEYNYAKFDEVDKMVEDIEFPEELVFEKVEPYGFRFGFSNMMFFIPCYSHQNGYYSSDVDIFYDGKHVLTADGEIE